MGNLKERLLSLIDNGATVATSLFDSMNETINSIDWDAQFDSMIEKKNSLMKKFDGMMSEFGELMKQVKNSITDFEVSVPFDKASGEEFKCNVDGNKLIVEVTFKNENTERSNKTTVMIPQNCDVEKLSTKYNAANKTMTVVIPKVLTEKEEEKVVEPSINFTTTDDVEIPTEKEEEPHNAESKLLRKFRETAGKATSQKVTLPRGANGRFIKRKPKN